MNQGLAGLDSRYLDDAATRVLSTSWKTIPSQELLLKNLREKFKEKIGTDDDYGNSCGLKQLEQVVSSFLENIEEIYCGKLELIIGDRKLDANDPQKFSEILMEYEKII